MSEEDIARLYTPYFRSDNLQARRMNAGGHGLGLNICNKIAEGLNGKILVES